MIHPLFRLIAAEPQMVADHLGGYCELFGDELRSLTNRWTRRLVLQISAALLLTLGLGLAGVSVLLWAVSAPQVVHASWALVVVPLVPLACGLLCGLSARDDAAAEGFATMRRQIDADVQMLRASRAA
jgi:hypothetical protein